VILHFYLSPYSEEADYDYDSWHGISRNVYRNVYQQTLEPSIRIRNGSKISLYQLAFLRNGEGSSFSK
jgi:hypothetical protein